jgi:transposase
MYCKYANLPKVEIESCVLPFIPSNKRGFCSRFDMCDIFRCIVHKLKTGCQWRFLFISVKGLEPPFSWQTVYYYYRRWCKEHVFEMMFRTYMSLKKDKLDTEKLNLDGTHSLVKKSAQSAAYQYRKRGRTSNILIMTDGRGIPIANGGILRGNHNDLHNVVSQYAAMIRQIEFAGISLTNSIQNADKGFDSKPLRRAIQRRKMIPNIKQNSRNRKVRKRGRKRYFNEYAYKTRFVNERCFAWIDSFRTLLVRFDTLDCSWLNWHYLAFAIMLLKV